jgi:hypothetical protein
MKHRMVESKVDASFGLRARPQSAAKSNGCYCRNLSIIRLDGVGVDYLDQASPAMHQAFS